MNFYASNLYLSVIARVYFPGKACSVTDYDVLGSVFRLLTVNGRPVLRSVFLDMHEPIGPEDHPMPTATLPYIPNVSHRLVSADEFQSIYADAHKTTPDAALRMVSPIGDPYMAAPTTIWEGVDRWEQYLESLRAKSSLVRDDERRVRRLQDSLGAIAFSTHDNASDVLPFCIQNKSRQTLETRGYDMFADPRKRLYLEILKEQKVLRITTIRASGRLLAAWLGVVFRGRWTGWVFAYDHDPTLRKYSVGRQLIYFMLEDSLSQGHQEFDFSIGDELYKWYFATHSRAVAPLGVLSARQRVGRWVRREIKRVLHQHPILEKGARIVSRESPRIFRRAYRVSSTKTF